MKWCVYFWYVCVTGLTLHRPSKGHTNRSSGFPITTRSVWISRVNTPGRSLLERQRGLNFTPIWDSVCNKLLESPEGTWGIFSSSMIGMYSGIPVYTPGGHFRQHGHHAFHHVRQIFSGGASSISQLARTLLASWPSPGSIFDQPA